MLDPRVAPKLQTPERQPIHARILAAGLDDEATYVAELLLAMTDGDYTIRISNWVAVELFELAISEWRAAVAALAAANLITVAWDDTATRATVTFLQEDPNA